MNKIFIEKDLTEDKKESLRVSSWPVWEKEVSIFDWQYAEKETCYIISGRAIVTTEQGESVEFSAGDLVVFSAGIKCRWEILDPVKKHYNFG